MDGDKDICIFVIIDNQAAIRPLFHCKERRFSKMNTSSPGSGNRAFVPIPMDLSRVKTKVALNLTKRQLICFSLAGVTSIPVYFLTKDTIGTSLASALLVVMAVPMFLMGVYEKDGRPLEKILMDIYEHKFKRPGIRPYETRDFYGMVGQEIFEREDLKLHENEQKNKKTTCKKKGGKGKTNKNSRKRKK